MHFAKTRNAEELRRLLQRLFGSRGVGLVLAEFDDPQAAVDVVDVDIAFVGIGAPGEGHVGTIGSGIAGPEAGDFAALIVEFAAQLTGNVKHASAAVVITHVQDIVENPDVVRAGFGNAVRSHLFGICEIARACSRTFR